MSSQAAEPTWLPATDNRVLVEGRTQHNADGALRVGYPGVSFHVRVDGWNLAMSCQALSDTVYLDVSVDGKDHERLKLDRGWNRITLINGASRVHDISITKRTESWQGELIVRGFESEGGKFLPPTPLPDRRLLFIGDSITCGAGTDVRPEDPTNGPHVSNGRLSFGTVLARRLGAQCCLVSYGGRGALRTWEDKTWPEDINAPQFYARAMPDDAESAWDASRFVPDAVAICLGTNDFGPGIPDKEAFLGAYVGLVHAVRRDAANAWVFLLNSPMYGAGEKGDVMRAWLDELADRLDDGRVVRARIGYYPGRPENSHPVAAEHARIADELEPLYRERLGW